MNYSILDALLEKNGWEYRADEPMSRHTSFKVGGPADRFVLVPDRAALSALVACLGQSGIPRYLVGKGSNLLVGDGGIRGAVLCLCGEFQQISLLEDGVICCGAGASLTALCNFAREKGLAGLEFAYGIPGSAGGAAYMNAGAYGGEMKDVLEACCHLEPDGSEGRLSGADLALGYRKSAYADSQRIITRLYLRLKEGNQAQIGEKMEELMNRRRSKQPLEYPSAGSTFKRPQGYFAAALIEECGLKGCSVGSAQVSEKHSGFIINKGGASCREILDLIDHVKREVHRQKQIVLSCEVKMIGEE